MTLHSFATVTPRGRWIGFCLALVLITQISQAQEARSVDQSASKTNCANVAEFPAGLVQAKVRQARDSYPDA